MHTFLLYAAAGAELEHLIWGPKGAEDITSVVNENISVEGRQK